MNEVHFDFAEYLRRVNSLRTRLSDTLRESNDGKVAALRSDVPTITSPNHGPPLTLAFVGQYNAGKSTIISALTGKRDIPIDTDVCTDTVTGYDWEGIRLLDTPGIHAGYPEHDELTYQTIDKADLLVFVITSELFDDVIGSHFQDLAFERGKASEILLAVNKMGMSPGSPEVKLPDLAKVTKPKAVQDFRTVFIDALSYLEAFEETDAEDQRELFDIAGFARFTEGLNTFVNDRDLMGRLTTPLFSIEAVAKQANAYLSVDMPEERATLELLSRKRSIFHSSRARLRSVLSGLVGAAAADITMYGDEVAETIEPGSTEENVQAQHEDTQKRTQERCLQLEQDVKSAVEAELCDLKRQLDTLQNGSLAQQLRDQVKALHDQDADDFGRVDSPDIEWTRPSINMPSDQSERLQKVSRIADTIGEYAAQWTTGPFAQATQFGSATAARGSQGHQVIYNFGKLLGINFKPWGAVNIAKHIGNAARVIAVIAGPLSVILQIVDEKKQDEYKRQLRDARDAVRQDYREVVREIEKEFWATYDKFSQEFYDSELKEIEELQDDLVGQRRTRTKKTDLLGQIISEARSLIQEVQARTD